MLCDVVNVNSLMNKLSFVNNLILTENLSVLGICETWLLNSVDSSFVDLPGFTFFRKDTDSPSRKHGVGVYCRSELQAVKIDLDIPNVLVIHIQAWDKHIVLAYRPPSNNASENEYCNNLYGISAGAKML